MAKFYFLDTLKSVLGSSLIHYCVGDEALYIVLQS